MKARSSRGPAKPDGVARGFAAAGLLLAYPAWSHAVVLSGHPRLSLPGLCLLIALCELVRGGGRLRMGAVVAIAVVALAAALDLALDWPLALYLPPVLIPLALALLFARSLREDRSLIERFVQDVVGDHNPRKVVYARRLTAFWAAVLFALALEAAVLALLAPSATWSLMTNIGNYLIVLGLFILEFAWRCHRFGPPTHPRALLVSMLRTDWRRLGSGHERG